MISPRIFGKNRNVLKCRLEDASGNQMEAVYFGDVEACLKAMEEKQIMSFTYYPSVKRVYGKTDAAAYNRELSVRRGFV